MHTSEELEPGDHILMPNDDGVMDIWLIMNAFPYTRRVRGEAGWYDQHMVTLDLLGPCTRRVHVLCDQKWEDTTLYEWEQRNG